MHTICTDMIVHLYVDIVPKYDFALQWVQITHNMLPNHHNMQQCIWTPKNRARFAARSIQNYDKWPPHRKKRTMQASSDVRCFNYYIISRFIHIHNVQSLHSRAHACTHSQQAKLDYVGQHRYSDLFAYFRRIFRTHSKGELIES